MATALTISAVAIYYSVAGLVAIFAGAAIPIIVMGSALEIGKLVTVVWLHRYWTQAKWWLKAYLSVAVLVLTLITSMGIFGFLSKAHIEQTTIVKENLAQIEQIDTEIERQRAQIVNAETRITQIQNQGSSLDDRIQQQIETEQQRIDTAYQRVQPEIERQQRIIDQELEKSGVSVFSEQLEKLTQSLENLDIALANNDVVQAQTIVGSEPDGALGPDTRTAIEQYRSSTQARITELQQQITELRSQPNPVIDAAREEINRLNARAETIVDDSNALISRLRSQLGNTDRTQLDSAIQQQRDSISQSTQTIQQLTDEKFELESAYRSLEAEVGPIKYIAEFIYAEQTDGELLEKAVRWVIVVIIFVFDPLALLLLIASQYTFHMHTPRKKNSLIPEKPQTEIKESHIKNEKPVTQSNHKDNEQAGTHDVEKQRETNSKLDQSETPPVEQNESKPTATPVEEVQRTNTSDQAVQTQEKLEDSQHTTNGAMQYVESYVENPEISTDIPDFANPETQQDKKKPSESLEQSEKLDRLKQYEQIENSQEIENDKAAWKKDHPNETLKHYKTLFVLGEIDQLPWQGYSQKVKPQEERYTQNSEQTETSIFNRIKRSNNL